MMKDKLKYDLRGVSADKTDVHKAIASLDKGLFPMAFCKVLPDHTGGDASYCNIMHADTSGTKTALAYLYWKETGDDSVWKDVIQDALVMNLDDLICVGAIDNLIFSSTIGRNKNVIPGSVVKCLIEGAASLAEEWRAMGIGIYLAGGETADVGDIVRTLDVGFTAFTRMKRSDLIVNDIRDGQVVVGLASYGQASYENSYNSGIGSNGLTSARHDVLDKSYLEQYPESFDPAVPSEVLYTGSRKLTDTEEQTGLPVGKLLLSPTRTYAPVIRDVLSKHRPDIHGMIHCSGGGQTKVLKFLHNARVVKDHLFAIPPLFSLIRQESATPWEEMYKVFNMGHRMELYVEEKIADSIIEIARTYKIDAQVVGRVEASAKPEVEIIAETGRFTYQY